MSAQDIKILERAIKSSLELHRNLEALDFQLEKFNKFEQKISSFKFKSLIVMASTGLIIGAFIGFMFSQKWAL